MKQSIITSVALLGTSTLASSVGNAIVVNSCTYDVHLCNTPAAGEGYDEYTDVLSPGQSWNQTYTKLNKPGSATGDGWAIKLSKSADLSNILQYEYTFNNDGNIWYDLSAVNGNPWHENWKLLSDSATCTPNQQLYRYSTDDDFGMQKSCGQDTSITVILCSAESQSSEPVSSIISSIAAASSTASPVASSSAPAASIPVYSQASSSTVATSAAWTPSSDHQHGRPGAQANYAEQSTAVVTSPTTFATSTTAAVEKAPGVTVYEVETAVVTAVVTAVYTAPSRLRRHEHHGDHHQHAI